MWAHELASMAAIGLEYTTNPYDVDRYQRLRDIAQGIAALVIDSEFTPERPYLPDVGYATTKVGSSVATFDDEGRVALIRRADNGRWALPGGFCEVGSTPSENALRELREETGLEAAIERFVGVYDNRHFNSTAPYHIYNLCFGARHTGGTPTPSIETPEVRFVAPDQLPAPMSDMQQAMIRDAVALTVGSYQ
jgi:ADP-ribose pyrophosphatase YjhB (NUDIX family)